MTYQYNLADDIEAFHKALGPGESKHDDAAFLFDVYLDQAKSLGWSTDDLWRVCAQTTGTANQT